MVWPAKGGIKLISDIVSGYRYSGANRPNVKVVVFGKSAETEKLFISVDNRLVIVNVV